MNMVDPERNIFREGMLENGNRFTVVGRPHNGVAAEVSETIVKIGQDVVMVSPRLNVVGVFDGAGGATDIGSPEKAALTAAQAVERYFKDGGDDLPDALEFARNAVKSNQEAGLCVAALARFHHDTVQAVNAGDTGVVCYDSEQAVLDVIVEQQSEFGQPTNYLGRHVDRIALPIPDASASYHQPYRSSQELYVLSDGAFGNWQQNNALESHHFQAAHNEYQLLYEARYYDKDFERNIRALLVSTAAAELRDKQIEEMGYVHSPELNDPLCFWGNSFDWSLWEEIVLPYIQTLQLPRSRKLGSRAICESLLARPISWLFERSPYDDASIVMIESADGS